MCISDGDKSAKRESIGILSYSKISVCTDEQFFQDN